MAGPDGADASAPHGYSVWRQDDHGAEVEVASGLTHGEALEKRDRLEAAGHKQAYWTAPTART